MFHRSVCAVPHRLQLFRSAVPPGKRPKEARPLHSVDESLHSNPDAYDLGHKALPSGKGPCLQRELHTPKYEAGLSLNVRGALCVHRPDAHGTLHHLANMAKDVFKY